MPGKRIRKPLDTEAKRLRRLLLVLLLAPAALAQPPVRIHVDAAHPAGPYAPIWQYFGADEPNYTYTPNGTQLLNELSRVDPATPVYFRPHNLLTSGDGQGSLKWGSTGVFTENPDGTAVYHWEITDRLFDNLAATHVRPLVEIGFMPEALSPHPKPYRHSFQKTGDDIFTGWSYPPKDYAKWRALIVAWVQHLHARYGDAVDTWQWEVWNEPDIAYFHGSVEDYERLYDISTAAVRQVLPHALVGGPGVTGPYRPDDPTGKPSFLRHFLVHCASGINADTGRAGVPLDFISFHPKGDPKFIQGNGSETGHVRMNLARQLQATDNGLSTVAAFPQYRRIPILLTETDPEGCAACQGPQNGYRNGTLYGVSVAEMLVRSAELAQLRGVNLAGAITWAFEFEDQPAFAGFRELAVSTPSGIIDKPVLNVFRLFAQLKGSAVPLTSSAALTAPEIEQHGLPSMPDISGLATRTGNTLQILLWNYADEDLPAPAAQVTLDIAGIPTRHLKITQTTVDHEQANSYTAWQSLGNPTHPSPAHSNPTSLSPTQVRQLQAAATLHPTPIPATNPITLVLPRQAVTLYTLSW